MFIERWVENLIKEAMERGDFDGLAGAGKPIDLNAYFDTPPELRVSYALMRNAGVVPREVELRREIAELENTALSSQPGRGRIEVMRRKGRLRLELSLLMDRNHSRRGLASSCCK